MKAIDILKEEHRVIERVLTILELAADHLEQGRAMRPGFFIKATEFIQGFADKCHHSKEEGVLFKAMADNGMPMQEGPIQVMLVEHELGRGYTQAMREAAQRLDAGDESAHVEVIRNARNYTALLREHITKEDNILYPMAENIIPPAQQIKLVEDFENVEHEEPNAHEKYLALADTLEKEIKDSRRMV